MSVKIYHNPRCSKSRETLALLEEKGIQPTIELYLQQHYSIEVLQQLANKLGLDDVRKMMRTKDELYQSLGLDNPALTNDDLLKALQSDALLGTVPAVKNGAVALIEDGSVLSASCTPSALSIPATIDEYLEILGAAASKVK